MLEATGQMTKTLNHTMYVERDHLKNPTCMCGLLIKDKHHPSPITFKRYQVTNKVNYYNLQVCIF
jgi:hypothetical protein